MFKLNLLFFDNWFFTENLINVIKINNDLSGFYDYLHRL